MSTTVNVGQSASTGSSPASSGVSAPALGYDSFLKLLVAQMQNQDPMDPMKSSDYVAQLATFSQVEKTVATNERIAELLTATQLQQAEGIVGRNVSSSDGSVSGVVSSSKVVSGAVVGILADGKEITLGPGVTVSGGGS